MLCAVKITRPTMISSAPHVLQLGIVITSADEGKITAWNDKTASAVKIPSPIRSFKRHSRLETVLLKEYSGGVIFQQNSYVVLGSQTKWCNLPGNIFKSTNFTELFRMMMMLMMTTMTTTFC
jgi:hypothetical protein